MNITEKRSKLVATIGPSSDKLSILRSLVEAGATCIRVNFSHGEREEQLKKFALAKRLSKSLGVPISTMLDTKGPEIRVGKMKNGAQNIESQQDLKIWTSDDKYHNFEGTNSQITVSYNMSKDLKVGDIILFDDGKLVSSVTLVEKDFVMARTWNSHLLKTNKRINLPGVDFSLPFLAQKDIDDIKAGIKAGVDYIAASFVNNANNVNELRKLLNDNGGSKVKIISKIESTLGVKNIEEIIEASDGIMVARGDLGLEIPYYDVPYFEKLMVRKCREKGKPIIVATQMLDSMENSPQPTRAEVTDVFYATELGADATMLSGESASGQYPLEAVKVMASINKCAEREFYNNKDYYDTQLEEIRRHSDPKDKRARIAFEVANRTRYGDYKYAVVLSRTGKLLDMVAKFRPNTMIIGIVNDPQIINSFGITSSVWVSLDSIKLFDKIKKNKRSAIKALKAFNVQPGDRFLIVENESLSDFAA